MISTQSPRALFLAGTSINGILAGGVDDRVLDNDIINTMPTLGMPATGIYFYGDNNLAVNNRITKADVGIRYVSGGGK